LLGKKISRVLVFSGAAALSVGAVQLGGLVGAGATSPTPTCATYGATLASGTTCEIDFSSVGSASWTVPAAVTSADVLVVGGGGGGGQGTSDPFGAGGGGGGQVLVSTGLSVSGTIPIVVGGGGQSGDNADNGGTGTDGQNSTFGSSVTAAGGIGAENGSSGDGAPSGSGNPGGATGDLAGGGGGGEGAGGADAVDPNGGAGGAGTTPSDGLFSGSSSCLGGGGGGGGMGGTGGTATCGGGAGADDPFAIDAVPGNLVPNGPATVTPAGAGAANTGGGGGGGSYESLSPGAIPSGALAPLIGLSFVASGDGGSGIVIVRFTLPTLPSAPLTISVTPNGPGSVVVSWSPPSDPGSTTITTYTVTASPGGATCTATSPATSCTISGLGAGSYTFSVNATNLAGTGPDGVATPAILTAAVLARTGAPLSALGFAGGSVLLAGGGLLLLARRRSSRA
jgi:hypothetical protein